MCEARVRNQPEAAPCCGISADDNGVEYLGHSSRRLSGQGIRGPVPAAGSEEYLHVAERQDGDGLARGCGCGQARRAHL